MTLKRLAESVGITAELPKWLDPIYEKYDSILAQDENKELISI